MRRIGFAPLLALVAFALPAGLSAADPDPTPAEVQAALAKGGSPASMQVKRWQGTVKVVAGQPKSKKSESTSCTVTWTPSGGLQYSNVTADNPVVAQVIQAGKQPPFFAQHLPFPDLRAEIAANIPNWKPYKVEAPADAKGRKLVATLVQAPPADDPAYQKKGSSYVAGAEILLDDQGRLTALRRRHQTRGDNGAWLEEWVTTLVKWADAKPLSLPKEIHSGCETAPGVPGKGDVRTIYEYGEVDGVSVLKKVTHKGKGTQWTMDVSGVVLEK